MELEAAQIIIVHGLARRICQENSEYAGIPANFTVLEDARGKICLNEGIETALAKLPQGCFADIPDSVMKESLSN